MAPRHAHGQLRSNRLTGLPRRACNHPGIITAATRFALLAGEMARPPQLGSEIPKVRADWQWTGEWWVSTNTDMRLANTRWNRVKSVEQIR